MLRHMRGSAQRTFRAGSALRRPVTTVRTSSSASRPFSAAATSAVDPTETVSGWLTDFENSLGGDCAGSAALFAEGGYWRDLVSFTWNLETFEGQEQIQVALAATSPKVKASNFVLEGEGTDAGSHIEGWFTFETNVGRGKGLVRLQEGKCWTLLTSLQELKGHEEPEFGATRPKGVEHGSHHDRPTWSEQKAADEASLGGSYNPLSGIQCCVSATAGGAQVNLTTGSSKV